MSERTVWDRRQFLGTALATVALPEIFVNTPTVRALGAPAGNRQGTGSALETLKHVACRIPMPLDAIPTSNGSGVMVPV